MRSFVQLWEDSGKSTIGRNTPTTTGASIAELIRTLAAKREGRVAALSREAHRAPRSPRAETNSAPVAQIKNSQWLAPNDDHGAAAGLACWSMGLGRGLKSG